MIESLYVSLVEMVNILDKVNEIYYKRLHLDEISEEEFAAVNTALWEITNLLEQVAEETDETNIDI